RHIAYSKKYLAENWGIDPDSLEIDFSPDTFGHSPNLPEIDGFGGVKYYYHCRGLGEDLALYRWKAPSGREMMNYREQHWYNSGITPKIGQAIFDIAAKSGGFKTGLVVYGVGDHGGGPTRRDVERGYEMMEWPVFPTIQFGTVREFFHEAEAVRDRLPLVEHELNFLFEGCYTTQSRIKRGNRRAENALGEAETFASLAHVLTGAEMRASAFERAWQKTLFTHFHDILTGSCVQDSREHAMGLFQDALATANTETSLALAKLSAAIDTSGIHVTPDPASQSEGAGAGYNIERFSGRAVDERGQGLTRIWNVFNSTAADRDEPVEITVWDWTGDLRYLKVTDADGEPLPFQKLDSGLQQYWDHKYFRFLVQMKIPAFSYATVVLEQGEMGDYPVYLQAAHVSRPSRNYVLDNGLVRAEFDYATGEMVSFRDLETGTELIAEGGRAAVTLIDTNRHNSNAWNIGTHLAASPVTGVTNIRGAWGGPLRQGFSFDAKVRASSVHAEYSLDRGSKAVRLNLRVDWSEIGGDTVPVLAYKFPSSLAAEKFYYNVPGGVALREAADWDRPGLSYAAAETKVGEDLLTIVTDSKYGFRCRTENGCAAMFSTLINTATSPDPYPERGIHEIGLTIGLLPACPVKREAAAVAANRPMTAVSTGAHKGVLPTSGTLFRVTTDAAVFSALTAVGKTLAVRFYSVSGEPGTVEIDAGIPVRAAYLTDLLGRRIGECAIAGTAVKAEAAPYAMGQIVMEY
ncbi:MAG: alpha-mannosidase, partial [Clostridia bacterium]|nr:alpha-mannosidase [Clostridia bacterium]